MQSNVKGFRKLRKPDIDSITIQSDQRSLSSKILSPRDDLDTPSS
jgi:hypothetical protein